MTINFSCDCGALFEVSEDMAGLLGRCRKCGREMTIPHESAVEATKPANNPESFLREESQPDTPESLPPHQEAPPPASTGEARFCPFCGKPTPTAADACPSCLKALSPTPLRLIDGSQLTLPDWILVTAFAPLGVLAGLISLVLGHKKGLNMIALAAACLVVWWFALAIVTWVR
jgi:hypothetical protein